MEPLTALSLAACIAQFLDFGSTLVKQTRQVASAGSSLSVDHLSSITADLVAINTSLEAQLRPTDPPNLSPPKEVQALLDLTKQCNDVAQELVRSLTQLTVNDSNKGKRWPSFRAALKTIWSKEHIDNAARRLSEFREQLTLRVLLLVNSNHAFQVERLDGSTREIVEVISLSCKSVKDTIEDRYRRDRSWQRRERAEAEERHARTIAAILTTREGASRTITGIPCPAAISGQLRSGNIESATTYSQGTDGSDEQESHAANFMTNNIEFTAVTQRILNALHFRYIDERRQAISKEHQKTYEWIYRAPVSEEAQWDSFSEWLQSGKGCYWLNGKAGSGKSTLMNYVQSNSITTKLLHEWSGSSDLVVASFFFWYAGTSLQKSQDGLLRSLLLTVLSKRPGLMPVLFPELFRSILSQQVMGKIDFSFQELRAAFMALMSLTPKDIKICFIIDGIDEYEGDHAEISDLLSNVSQCENVKILLSSRPIPACVRAFQDFPKLHLQDLTHNDIAQYAQDKLGNDDLMQKMNSIQQGATQQLVDGITSKASGVFLWVILVVRRLLQGLGEYDTLTDLLGHLDQLPSDLEALYEHMLGDMSAQVRQAGSRLLQIVLRSLDTHGDFPMTLLQLSFAEEGNHEDILENPPFPFSGQELNSRFDVSKGRLRSRCCGLIEVQGSQRSTPMSNGGRIVRPFHRTVVEFLRLPAVWNRILCLTAKTSFDVDRALLSSTLCEMRVQSLWRGQDEAFSPTLRSILRFLSYEQHMEDLRHMIHSAYMPLVRAVAAYIWHDKNLFESSEEQEMAVSAITKRTCSGLNLQYPYTFLLGAAIQCPRAHLESLLDYTATTLSETPVVLLSTHLLIQFLDEAANPLRSAMSHNIQVCVTKQSIAPITMPNPYPRLTPGWNEDRFWDFGGYTWWELMLRHTSMLNLYYKKQFFRTRLPILLLDSLVSSMEAGVDPRKGQLPPSQTIVTAPLATLVENIRSALSTDEVLKNGVVDLTGTETFETQSADTIMQKTNSLAKFVSGVDAGYTFSVSEDRIATKTKRIARASQSALREEKRSKRAKNGQESREIQQHDSIETIVLDPD